MGSIGALSPLLPFICRDQMPFNHFLFTCDVVTPQDFQPRGSGLRASHFPFIQEGILRTNIRWVKPTREINLQIEKRDVRGEIALGKQNSPWSSPCAARCPSPDNIHSGSLDVVCYSPGSVRRRNQGPAPSPAAPSPLRTAPKMPRGVKSRMASQLPSWPSFTSISFVSLRSTAAGRGREPGQRGAEGGTGAPRSP